MTSSNLLEIDPVMDIIIELPPFNEYQMMEKEEEIILCKTFGCGKILSITEKLFGDYCCVCSNNKNIRTFFDGRL